MVYSGTAAESIFGRGMVPFIVVLGVITSLVSIGVGLLAFRGGDPHWQTLLFTALAGVATLAAVEAWKWALRLRGTAGASQVTGPS